MGQGKRASWSHLQAQQHHGQKHRLDDPSDAFRCFTYASVEVKQNKIPKSSVFLSRLFKGNITTENYAILLCTALVLTLHII
jgi:hypothetical protein